MTLDLTFSIRVSSKFFISLLKIMERLQFGILCLVSILIWYIRHAYLLFFCHISVGVTRKLVMASLSVSDSSQNLGARAVTTGKVRKGCLVASIPEEFSKKSSQCVSLMKLGVGHPLVGELGVFLLTTAALETVRRFSNAKCPFVWKGLQALQILCNLPFSWIQRWTPKGLVKNMQVGFDISILVFMGSNLHISCA